MGRLPATGITCGTFMTESIARYYMGKSRDGKPFNLQPPPPGKLTGGIPIGAVQRRPGSS